MSPTEDPNNPTNPDSLPTDSSQSPSPETAEQDPTETVTIRAVDDDVAGPNAPVTPAVAADPAKPAKARRWLMAAAALVLVVGGSAAVLNLRGDDDASAAAVATEADDTEVLYLQPANDLGPDSFTETPLASENPDSASPSQMTPVNQVVEAKTRTTRAVPAGSVGLYGGSTDEKVCSKEQLIDYLESNPGKAKAWVAALNADPKLRWSGGKLTVKKIPDYINESLMPAVVLRDTLVVNHGYARSGVPTTFNSVLEAGTKALVDKYGVFRVRCFCGNPLLGAAKSSPTRFKVIGKGWPETDKTKRANDKTKKPPAVIPETVTIRESEKALESLPLVQPDGSVIQIRTGSDGLAKDAVTAPTPTPTPTSTPTATPTPSPASTTPAPTATSPTTSADQACAESFCVPLRPGWTVGSSSATQLRLIDSKGRAHDLTETSATDPAVALDDEKNRRESLTPPCRYVKTRDSVTAGSQTLLRDRWDASTCDVVNTVALVSPTTGRVILGASSNDGELRQVVFAGMTFR